MDFDFNKPFFEQFKDLKKQIPHLALSLTNSENSDYTNLSGYNKNCYLIFAAEYNEDSLYGTQIIKSKNCIDTLNSFESENCYEVTDISKCYELFFSKNCRNCHSSIFLSDSRNCGDCLFCTNLRNKTNYVFNRQVSKEEYEQKKKEILQGLAQGKLKQYLKEFLKLDKLAVHRAFEAQNNENSLGNYLYDSKNCDHCFDLNYGQDCKFVYTGFNVKDLMDVCHTTDAELAYEVTSLGYNSYNILFGLKSWTSNNSMYFEDIHSSSEMFGCIGLKHQKNCILNKKYSKEEYDKLLPKIIEHMRSTGEWGEFFPINLFSFAYNETLANDYFSLTEEQAKAKGYLWRDKEEKEYMPPTSEILACEDCGKNYRIIPQELNFYHKYNLPIPAKCPDCRHKPRFNQRPQRKVFANKCSNCAKDIQTVYSPESKTRVYCEECYLEEVI